MPRLELPSRQIWNNMVAALTASLSSWQAARKGELDATRTAVADQGAQAANLGNIAKQNGETAVSIAQQARAEALKLAIVDPRFVSTTTANPRIVTSEEWNAENGANKSYIGSRLTDDNTVQLLKYNGASGNWDAVGAPILARNQLDAGLDHAYYTAVAPLIVAPRFLSKLRAGLPVKILGVGSSSMEGVGSTDYATKSFLPQFRDRLAELFPQSVITIVNRGVGGRTLAELEPEILTYLADQADLVVITVGWNDASQNRPTLPEFRRRYESFCRALNAAGADVLAMSSQWGMYEQPIHQQFNRAIQAAADAAGVGFFSRRDFEMQIVKQGKVTRGSIDAGDGLHRNNLGYALWGEATAQTLYLASAQNGRSRSVRLPMDSTVFDPPLPPGSVYHNELGAAGGHPQLSQYFQIPLPANTTQRLSVSWVGTGIRWATMIGDYWPDGCTIRYRVDEGAWISLPIPRMTGGQRQRGGAWTLVEHLPQRLHFLEMEIINGAHAASGGNVFMAGWDAIYTEGLGTTYHHALATLFGPYAVMTSPLLSAAGAPDTLQSAVYPGRFEVLVGGAAYNLGETYETPSRRALHAPGDATYDRIDAVLLCREGGLTVISGVPAAVPQPPANLPAGVLLGHVRVLAGATNNSKFVVTDKRRIVAGVQQQVAPPALTAAPTQADMNAWRDALIAAGVWRT